MRAVSKLLVIALSIGFAGCEEEISPQAQSPQTGGSAPATASDTGPITSLSNQGGGSALGAAKRSATNIANQAQQQSSEIAGEPDPPDDDEW